MDVRALDFKLGETPFDKIQEIIISADGYSCGSGDNFVNKEIDMNVDVVDMEAYAIAKVCIKEKIDFKCFKYISDNADENSGNDWNFNDPAISPWAYTVKAGFPGFGIPGHNRVI